KKVTYENLRLRDQSYTDKVLQEFNQQHNNNTNAAAFSTFKLRGLELSNRIVMSSMGQYSANNGLVNNWHFQHYTSRAIGGLGLIITEMTAVDANGRITLGCAGIYNEEQVIEWKKTTDFVHENTATKIGMQLGHSGRKGAVKKPWEAVNEPVENAWELLSASAIAFNDKMAVPKEMNANDMQNVINQFANAAK